MTTMDITVLEQAVSAAFHSGERTVRELRLTAEEAEHLRAYAVLTLMPGRAEEKSWYEVSLKGALVK